MGEFPGRDAKRRTGPVPEPPPAGQRLTSTSEPKGPPREPAGSGRRGKPPLHPERNPPLTPLDILPLLLAVPFLGPPPGPLQDVGGQVLLPLATHRPDKILEP